MGTIDSINGVEASDIDEYNGVEASDIENINGEDVPIGTTQATRWLVGASGGRIYVNDSPGGSFLSSSQSGALGLAVDHGGMTFYNMAYGLDASSQPRWIAHSDDSSKDLFYISASQDVTTSGNWTSVNVSNGKLARRGGPSVRNGNGNWFAVGAGRAIGANRLVMMSSSNGGSVWNEVNNSDFIGTSNTGYVVYHVSGNTWYSPLGVGRFYSSSNATTWVELNGNISGYEVYCMGYNANQGANGRWVMGTNSGKIYFSDDNFATDPTEAVSPFGSSNVFGLIYAGGTINKWIAIAANGKIAHSNSGSAFTSSTMPSPIGSSHHMRGIASDNSIVVAVGATNGGNNCLLSSSNGVNWTYISSSAVGTVNFESIACNVLDTPTN